MNIKHFCHKSLFVFGTARLCGFWEMSIADVLVRACVLFDRERVCIWTYLCVRASACTWTLVAWLAVCVCTVLQDAAESCAWSGDVMMSCGFPVLLLSLFLLGQSAGNHLRCLLFFVSTKASKIGGFLWKKTCPRNNVACWNYILAFFSQFVFHCFLNNAYWMLFPVLAALVVVLFLLFPFVSRKWWFKIAKDMLSTSNPGDLMPYRSFLLYENCKRNCRTDWCLRETWALKRLQLPWKSVKTLVDSLTQCNLFSRHLNAIDTAQFITCLHFINSEF